MSLCWVSWRTTLTLLPNISQTQRNLPDTNTLAYFATTLTTTKICFITLAPCRLLTSGSFVASRALTANTPPAFKATAAVVADVGVATFRFGKVPGTADAFRNHFDPNSDEGGLVGVDGVGHRWNFERVGTASLAVLRTKVAIIVKNPFGVTPINVFKLGIIYMPYRQVLTTINNFQLLLKLPILDKFRLAKFHKVQHKETKVSKTGINQFRRNESSHDLESSRTIWRWVLLKHVPFLQCH